MDIIHIYEKNKFFNEKCLECSLSFRFFDIFYWIEDNMKDKIKFKNYK